MSKTTTNPLQQALPLLGGISPETFMRRYWQKKPLLIRQALPGVRPPVDRAEMFRLAGSDDVESRLIVQQPPKAAEARGRQARAGGESAHPHSGWSLRHGPLARRSLPPLEQPGWTLLVQGLDLHAPAAHDLMSQFRFIPDARLDDVMVSWASDGGGVGPHFDSYDVFLLQVQGRRRWRIGRLNDDTLVPGLPLKILGNFQPEEEWLLEPGDMLYLPPKWAHDGVAEGGDCMTCSIGFRVPEANGLAAEILARVAEHLEPEGRLYRDPKQAATAVPAAMPADLQQFAMEAVERALKDPAQLHAALGEIMTEPKPKVWFDAGEPWAPGQGVVLDARTRMLYDDQRIYANGESWRAAGADARLLRRLADQRHLTAAECHRASEAVQDLLGQWSEDGWLRPTGD